MCQDVRFIVLMSAKEIRWSPWPISWMRSIRVTGGSVRIRSLWCLIKTSNSSLSNRSQPLIIQLPGNSPKILGIKSLASIWSKKTSSPNNRSYSSLFKQVDQRLSRMGGVFELIGWTWFKMSLSTPQFRRALPLLLISEELSRLLVARNLSRSLKHPQVTYFRNLLLSRRGRKRLRKGRPKSIVSKSSLMHSNLIKRISNRISCLMRTSKSSVTKRNMKRTFSCTLWRSAVVSRILESRRWSNGFKSLGLGRWRTSTGTTESTSEKDWSIISLANQLTPFADMAKPSKIVWHLLRVLNLLWKLNLASFKAIVTLTLLDQGALAAMVDLC